MAAAKPGVAGGRSAFRKNDISSSAAGQRGNLMPFREACPMVGTFRGPAVLRATPRRKRLAFLREDSAVFSFVRSHRLCIREYRQNRRVRPWVRLFGRSRLFIRGVSTAFGRGRDRKSV